MAGYKPPNFNERAAASRAAKQSALEELRNRPAPDPAKLAEQQARREQREAAAAERREARQRALEEAKAAKLASKAAALQQLAAAAPPPPAPKRTEAELKAARDERYAARKARKK